MQQWRFKAVRICLVLLFIAVVLRLCYWQLFASDHLKAQAETQRTVNEKILGKRGTVLFSDGSPLVTSQLSYVLFADKNVLKDTKPVAAALSPLLNESEATISAKLSTDATWVAINKQITPEKKQQISSLNIYGLGFDRKEERFYPEATMAASLLGFVGKDKVGRDTGYFGLEGYYNNLLEGKAGSIQQERDVSGRPILTGQTIATAPKNGDTLVLYIDRTIQYIAEQKLKEGLAKYGAAAGDIVIMDPKTGGILAMASNPSYDPKKYYESAGELYKNPIVSDTYEPGSTFKSIVMSAAINEGAVKADSICPCSDKPRTIGGFTIHNWDNKYRTNETMGDILKNSDNNGMTYVGDRLGADKLVSYLEKFGVGSSTNIDLQDEEVPHLRPKKDWYPIDYSTATFGQGIAVTPIQVVRAVGAIANGGKLMEPHMVKKIVTEDKEVEIQPKVVRQVISEEAAKTMTQLLTYVVDNSEAKRYYKPKGFSIAAKSGTAQIAIAGHYDDASNVISSYVGFGPTTDPRFVMFVRFKKPAGGEHGATTAGPVFYDIAKELFMYWGIAPDRPDELKS